MLETIALGVSGFLILVLALVWRTTDVLNVSIKVVLFFSGFLNVLMWAKRMGVL